ncbi:hypothetical protein HCG49_16595 [Arenibacter sp. 6A1]|uniref:hypothetical protein n=1 Tax=Arenibacter sp. 6A1 TaxID=2720391 RepID=UPI001444A359|nr:hypothetical protein [Arenibacter sp. 6A1]NKI28175.1 hypothetical protein [Arenibacter sp. 6A1]
MDYKYIPLRNWLLERDALSIRKLEVNCGIPKDTLRHFLSERRDFPEKHYRSLLKELVKYGFDQE